MGRKTQQGYSTWDRLNAAFERDLQEHLGAKPSEPIADGRGQTADGRSDIEHKYYLSVFQPELITI